MSKYTVNVKMNLSELFISKATEEYDLNAKPMEDETLLTGDLSDVEAFIDEVYNPSVEDERKGSIDSFIVDAEGNTDFIKMPHSAMTIALLEGDENFRHNATESVMTRIDALSEDSR